MKDVICTNLTEVGYEEAFSIQEELLEYLKTNPDIPGFLLFVEHPKVFTVGVNGQDEDFLIPESKLIEEGFEIFKSNRGGNVTYHGPGQLVAYPILNLNHFNKDIKWYVWNLEEWVIQTLVKYGIQCDRKPSYRGVWFNNRKICAIGVAVKKWITMHGIGLNNRTNMSHFSKINPCGITEFGVTSIALEGEDVSMKNLCSEMMEQFELLFDVTLTNVNLSEVLKIAKNNK